MGRITKLTFLAGSVVDYTTKPHIHKICIDADNLQHRIYYNWYDNEYTEPSLNC